MFSDTESAPSAIDPPRSVWPTVWGWIAIAWAALGVLMLCCMFIGLAMQGTGSDTNPMPNSIKVVTLITTVVAVILTVVLFGGGIGLLRRKRSARGWMLTYVVASLLWIPASLIATKVIGPERDAFNRRAMSEQIDEMERNGDKAPDFLKDMAAGKSNPFGWVEPTCIMLSSIVPLAFGFIILRKREEIDRWP